MTEAGSPSIDVPDYWWYRARAELLEAILSEHVGEPRRLLDVGSADGPSVSWLRGHGKQVALDVDPRGLGPGGVCGSALELPFGDEVFDVVAAFDVIEHCDPEAQALTEVFRVLSPGGRFLLSVPAYQWAWTQFDDHNHHFRRYTRRRAVRAVRRAGFHVDRATYMFGATFPMFAAQRLVSRFKERGRRGHGLGSGAVPQLPSVSPPVEKVLMGLSGLDRKFLGRRNLPFGSSVVVVARKPF
jgi:SAM-dependent methyltransferase